MALNRDVKITLIGEDKASKAFGKAGKSAGGLSGVLGKLGGALPVAGAGLAIVGGGLIKLSSSFIETSSRLENLAAKSQTVFGDQVGDVQAWAKANSKAMKLTSSEALGLATNMADLLIPMGFTRKAAADLSKKTIGLSGALAKWSGGAVTATDAAGILTDAYLGETDGLKALGISISAAEIDQRLLAKGQDKLTGSALAQAQAMATQALIFEKSTDAQAGAASGTKTLADRMDNLRLKMREAWEQLVIKLTPAAEKFADFVATKGAAQLAAFAGWVQTNKAAIIGFAASAVTGLADVVRALGTFLSASSTAFGQALISAGQVAEALGNKGLGDKLQIAGSKMVVFGATSKQQADKAANAIDVVGQSLRNLQDRTIFITTVLRTENARDRNTASRGTVPGQSVDRRSGALMSNARVAAAPVSVNINGPVYGANSRELANNVRQEFTAMKARGTDLGFA